MPEYPRKCPSFFFFFFFFFKELRNFLFGKLEEGQVCIYGLVIIIPYFGLVGGGEKRFCFVFM